MRPCRSPFVMTARSGHGSAFTGRGDGWQFRCGALINGVIMSGSRLAVRNSGRAALSPEWSIPRVPSCMSNMVGLSRVCRYWRSGRALCAGLCTPAGIACGIWGTACAGTHIPSAMCDDVPRPKRGSGFRVCGSHFGFGFVNKTFCRRGTRFPGTAISAAMRSAATTTAPPHYGHMRHHGPHGASQSHRHAAGLSQARGVAPIL